MAPSLAPLKDTAMGDERRRTRSVHGRVSHIGSAGGITWGAALSIHRDPGPSFTRRPASRLPASPASATGRRRARPPRPSRGAASSPAAHPRPTAHRSAARVLLASHRSAAGVAEPRVMSVAHRSALRRGRPGRRAEAGRRGVIAMGHGGARRGSHPFGRVGASHVLVPTEDAQELAEHGPRRPVPARRRRRCGRTGRHSGAQRGRVRERRPPGRPSARLRTRYACDPSVSADRRTAGSVCSVGGTALPSLGTKLSVRWPSGVWPVGAARSRFAGAVKWPCPTTLRRSRAASRRLLAEGAGPGRRRSGSGKTD